MFVVNGDGKSFFVGWGELFVHERAKHVCKEAEDASLKHFTWLAYKSSLRDSICRWTPRGKNATSDVIRTLKSSL